MSLGLPGIDSIKDILTGSISAKFQALIEPYALVNAGIFLTLNLTIVYSQLGSSEARSRLLATISSLSVAWQIVLVTFILFILSYFIYHLSQFFLDFTSGEFFRDSPLIGKWLQGGQKRRYLELKNFVFPINKESAPPNVAPAQPNEAPAQLNKAPAQNRDEIAYFLAYHYPIDEAEVGLSALGNLLISPASYVFHQYGASMDLIWPIIHDKLGEDNKTIGILQGNWISLLFFSSLQMLLMITGFEVFCIFTFIGGSFPWIQIIALMIGAFACYYLSLEKALQWGRSMRRVFDSHIKDAFIELGMGGIQNLTPAQGELKNLLSDISSWLAYGALDSNTKASKSWYSIPAASKPEVWPKINHPSFLMVESHRSVIQDFSLREEPTWYECFENRVDYLFVITNVDNSEHPITGENAYLLVEDAEIAPSEKVQGILYENNRQGNSISFNKTIVNGILQSEQPSAQLFPLDKIGPGNSRILQYSCRSPAFIKIELDKNKMSVKAFQEGEDGFLLKLQPQPGQEKNETSVTVQLINQSCVIVGDASISRESDFPEPLKCTKDDDLRKTWKLNLNTGQTASIRIWKRMGSKNDNR